MGLMDRITGRRKRRRHESVRDPFSERGEPGGKNEPPSHVSEIITEKIEKRDEREHQRKMALYSPVATYFNFKLPQNVYDDGWEMVNLNGKTVHPEIMARHIELNSKYWLTQAYIIEMIYGHSWLHVVREKARAGIKPEDLRITHLDVYGPENSEVIKYDKKTGMPSEIEVTVPEGLDEKGHVKERKFKVKARDLVLFRTRPYPHERSFEGIPYLYANWTTLVSLERTIHSSDFYNGKIGHGMYVAKTVRGMTDQEHLEFEATMEKGSVSRVVTYDAGQVEDLKFINATGSPVDFPSEIDSRMGLLAAGGGVPEHSITGAPAGAITGSETNVKTLFQTLNQLQTSVEPPMREFDAKLGATGLWLYRWIRRYAHDEESQAKIELTKTQTLATSTWLTINEKRATMGLDEIPGGDVLEDDFRINVQGIQTAEEAEKTQNPDGLNK